MMAELASRGIEVGYNFELDPDPNSSLGVPQQFWNMINCNLAVRLIADFNKVVPDALLAQASQSMSNASARCAADKIRMVQYPSRQPVGSGNRVYSRWARFYTGMALPPNAPSTLSIAQGETNDFTESFEAYLYKDEIIVASEVVCDPGLVVISSANESPLIRYRLNAPESLVSGTWQQVRIRVETSLGRVDIRLLNYQVAPYVTVGNN